MPEKPALSPRFPERDSDQLVGKDKIHDLIRSSDWPGTSLGPRESWPQSLRTIVNVILAALSDDEAKYRSLFEAIDEGFCIIEVIFEEDRPVDYRFLEVNSSFERQTGLVDAKGKRIRELLPLHEEHWFATYGRVAVTGRPERFQNRTGPIGRWYDVFAFRVARPEDHRVAILFDDITELKQAEQALRQGKERSELLATISERLLRSQNPQADIEEACAMVMKFLDCQVFFNYLVKAPGKSMHLNAFAGITAAEAERVRALDFGVAVCGCVARDCQRIIAEDVQHGSDKSTELIKSYGIQAYCCHPLMAQNRLIGTMSFGTRTRSRFADDEIILMKLVADQVAVAVQRLQTEETLRRRESKYRELVQNANSAIIRWRKDGAITFFNEYAQAFFGYSAKEIIGRDVRILIPKDESRNVNPQDLVRSVLEHPERYTHNVNENVCRDGRRVWMSWTNRPAFDNDGSLSEILSIGTDITSLKRMEDNLRRSHDELELRVQQRTKELSDALQKLQERSDQLRQMSAELTLAEQRERQKLAHMLHDGLQQLLVGAQLHVEFIEQDKNMADELVRLKDILSEAINASRSLAMELHPPILLRNDLSAALNWLADWKREKYGLRVTVKCRENLPSVDYEVMLLLFQSVRELLFNVVKHAGVNEATVELNQQDKQILLTIEDKGVGFDLSDLRLQGGESEGYGLFSISERLSTMSGQMEIKSAPGRGCRIRLKIPLSLETKEMAQGSIMGQRIEETSVLSDRNSKRGDMKIRILLTDDHEVVRQGVANLIGRESDFEIVGEASNGESAVNLVRETQPDVVLMDVNMPVMDGIEATRRIHSEFPGIGIIGFSIHDEESQRKAMLEAGAVGYFAKRGSMRDLAGTIRSCVRGTLS